MKKIKVNKKKKIISVLLLISFYLIFIVVEKSNTMNILLQKLNYDGGPIDKSTGIINNKYFNIHSDGTHEEETTKGINEAIKYCTENNISFLKLEKGIYSIKCGGDFYEQDGIMLNSNLTMDINCSTIYAKQNSEQHYAIMSLFNVENIEIKNGILVGDKNDHDYSDGNSHQWGFGIDIRNSYNILINNLEIYNMTGDGIYISNLNNGETDSILIKNNVINNCRRQGISVICGKNITIEQNEIYAIGGTAPQSGIDLEANNDNQNIEDIKIYDNIIHLDNYAVICSKGTRSVEIQNNNLYGKINVSEAKEKLAFENNTMHKDFINIEQGENKEIKEVLLKNNIFNTSNVKVKNTKNIQIVNNSLENSSITFTSSNGIVSGNEINNNQDKIESFACRYQVENEDENNYTIYHLNNKITGMYKNDVSIQECENLQVKIE